MIQESIIGSKGIKVQKKKKYTEQQKKSLPYEVKERQKWLEPITGGKQIKGLENLTQTEKNIYQKARKCSEGFHATL